MKLCCEEARRHSLDCSRRPSEKDSLIAPWLDKYAAVPRLRITRFAKEASANDCGRGYSCLGMA